MKVINWKDLQSDYEWSEAGSGISVGSFDGLHQGHRSLLDSLVTNCKSMKLIPGVLSFLRPLPSLKHNTDYPGDISTLKQRLFYLEKAGIEFVILADFNPEFASLTGSEFFDILRNKINLKFIAEGVDFRCGYKGAWDMAAIKEYALENNLETAFVEPVYYKNQKEKRISSSNIRRLIHEGNFFMASELLVRPFQLDLEDCVLENELCSSGVEKSAFETEQQTQENKNAVYTYKKTSILQVLPEKGQFLCKNELNQTVKVSIFEDRIFMDKKSMVLSFIN